MDGHGRGYLSCARKALVTSLSLSISLRRLFRLFSRAAAVCALVALAVGVE
jgi:hypothetical protein